MSISENTDIVTITRRLHQVLSLLKHRFLRLLDAENLCAGITSNNCKSHTLPYNNVATCLNRYSGVYTGLHTVFRPYRSDFQCTNRSLTISSADSGPAPSWHAPYRSPRTFEEQQKMFAHRKGGPLKQAYITPFDSFANIQIDETCRKINSYATEEEADGHCNSTE